jgi:mannose-6-phosphate isomerase-like protein (cupin superfamily)
VQAVHCTLPAGGAIKACRHKTVAQLWYVLSGKGEMWLAEPSGKEQTFPLSAGVSFVVHLGDSFQFRNVGKEDLQLYIVNTTPWSGPEELIPVKNHWKPNY